MPSVFFTGFPGFLGSALLPRTLKRHADEVSATCLVQARFMPLAQRRVGELRRAIPSLADRIHLVEGDITRPDLGLGEASELKREVVEIFHLAAIYDLAVRREPAMRVNLDGTRHLLDFAVACPGLRRFQYVSTCYVSGRYDGVFSERDLEKGQSFQNYYEETKYLAELEVQRRLRDGVPVTVYRPAIVVGDSTVGSTQKYDGPYYLFRLIARQGRLALVPKVGAPGRSQFNLVPSDYVVNAIAHLAGLESTRGQVFQLCDPNPLTMDEVMDAAGQALGKRLFKLRLPAGLARAALTRTPAIARALQIPPETLDYLTLPTRYTCENTLAGLEGSGIHCPGLRDYLPRLVEFMKAHPEIGSAAMS